MCAYCFLILVMCIYIAVNNAASDLQKKKNACAENRIAHMVKGRIRVKVHNACVAHARGRRASVRLHVMRFVGMCFGFGAGRI